MSSAESYLSLLDRVVRLAERLCEGELCCLRHKSKASALCLFYKSHRRADHSLHEHLHQFVAARNTRGSAALCELALVKPGLRTDQFSPSFLPPDVRL